MNIDMKKTVGGIIILFLIFCVAFVINKVLDRSDEDSIIINTAEEESQTENITETEAETNSETETETSGGLSGYLKYEGENGDVYEGNMKNGKYNGTGVLSRKTGEIYDGDWIDGAFEKGSITFKTNGFGGTKTINITYDENWDGTGECAMILDGGEIYSGQWYENKRDGAGMSYTRGKNGEPTKIKDGVWEDDSLVSGKETYIYNNDTRTLIVEIDNGLRNGKGILYDENGNVIEEEEWRDDIPVS